MKQLENMNRRKIRVPGAQRVVGKGLEVRLGQRVTGARQKVNLISQNSLLFKEIETFPRDLKSWGFLGFVFVFKGNDRQKKVEMGRNG